MSNISLCPCTLDSSKAIFRRESWHGEFKFRPFTLPQTLKLKFCRGTVRPTSFCTVSLACERSFIRPHKCIGRLWKWWCDYLWLRSLTTGAFSKLPFQSVHLKWVYSDCFPLDRKQQANWIRWKGTMAMAAIFRGFKQHRCRYLRDEGKHISVG